MMAFLDAIEVSSWMRFRTSSISRSQRNAVFGVTPSPTATAASFWVMPMARARQYASCWIDRPDNACVGSLAGIGIYDLSLRDARSVCAELRKHLFDVGHQGFRSARRL